MADSHAYIQVDNSLTVGSYLRQGWQVYKTNSCLWKAGLIFAVYELLLTSINIAISPTADFIFNIIMAVTFMPILMLGVMYMALQAVRGQGRGLADIGFAFKRAGKNWLISFLFYTATFIGYFFLIIPGMYLCVTYVFSLFIINDKDVSVLKAFEEAGKIVDGFRWQILALVLLQFIPVLFGIPFTYGVSMAGTVNFQWAAAGLLPSLFAYVVLMPILLTALAAAYENILSVYERGMRTEELTQTA